MHESTLPPLGQPSDPQRDPEPSMRRCLAQAVIRRLKRQAEAAQRLEVAAWTMSVGKIPAPRARVIFAEYTLALAVRLARDGRFNDADNMLVTAAGGVLGGSLEGIEQIDAATDEIDEWRSADLEEPELIIAAARLSLI